MTSRILLVVLVVTSLACGADTATQRLEESPSQAAMGAPEMVAAEPASVVPENAEDSSIRRELNLAIHSDSGLKEREISFIVSNGDVSVTGIVYSESERERINGLAMGIPGVKSVANALRVSE